MLRVRSVCEFVTERLYCVYLDVDSQISLHAACINYCIKGIIQATKEPRQRYYLRRKHLSSGRVKTLPTVQVYTPRTSSTCERDTRETSLRWRGRGRRAHRVLRVEHTINEATGAVLVGMPYRRVECTAANRITPRSHWRRSS